MNLSLIGLARLTPEDAVIFPDKKMLYRKEKDRKSSSDNISGECLRRLFLLDVGYG